MTAPSQTAKQVQQIGDSSTDWTQILEFGQFDPSLGTLDSVEAGLSTDLTGSLTIESLEAGPAVVTAALDSAVWVISPDGALARNEIDTSNSMSFNAAGGSATFSLGGTASSNLNTSTPLPYSSAFIGTGTVPLTVMENSYLDVTGPANMAITSRASAGAVVSMQYAYQSAGGGNATGFLDWSTLTDRPIVLHLPTQHPMLQGVTTAAQTFTIADATSGWTDDVPIQQFDSRLGTLIAIDFTVTGDINASVSATNDDPVTSIIDTAQTISVSAGGFVSTSASVLDSMNLASGASHADEDLTKSNTTSGQVADPSVLAAYTGSGTVDLPISSGSNAWLTGPGNLDATLLAEAGGTVTVSYTYLPTGSSEPVAPVWTNTNGGDWTDASNWDLNGGLPQATDDVTINGSGNYTVVVNANETIASLEINAPGATVLIDDNLSVTGELMLNAGTIEFNGGTLTAGTVELGSSLAHIVGATNSNSPHFIIPASFGFGTPPVIGDPIALGPSGGTSFSGDGPSFVGYGDPAGAGSWATQGGSGSPMAGCYLAPSGNNTIVAGSLHDLIGFANGAAGGANTIQDFLPGRDHIGLSGYGLGVVASVLQSESTTAGGTTATLPDGTSITVAGVNHLTSSDFITG